MSSSSPRASLLSNGRFSILVTASGGGGATWNDLAVTRWTSDATRDADGCWLYLRDLDTSERWSAAAHPVPFVLGENTVRFRGGVAELQRVQSGIVARTEICVAAGVDAELRRLTIENRSGTSRRLELTTYAELVLNGAAAAAGHPAFSKLFVQTSCRDDENGRALVAWRRLRSPDDQPMWVAQRFVSLGTADQPSFETDRMRFLGRGRTPANPIALELPGLLSGTIGNVLDPIFAMRHVVELAPGECAQFVSVLAAGASAQVTEDSARFVDERCVAEAFASAEGSTPVESEGTASSWFHAPPVGDPDVTPQASTSNAQTPLTATGDEALHFFNGIGGFSEDGSEYVMRIPGGSDPARLPPLPWTNVVANAEAGFVVSEAGATHTWSANSRENRLTPWPNDPVSDPHVEALYLRDERTGHVWSPTPGPIPGSAPYEVRHTLGASRFRTDEAGLSQDVWMFVPTDSPVKIVHLRVTNRGSGPRRLSLYWYAQLVLGGLPHETAPHIEVTRDQQTGALHARNPERGEFSERVAFASVVAPPGADVTSTADRVEVLGARGAVSSPAAVLGGKPLEGRVGKGIDPCAAYRIMFELAEGASVECAFLLGEAEDARRASEIVNRFTNTDAVRTALDGAKAFWGRFTSGIAVETPSRALNVMVNQWLPYQNLSCRMWGRTAFYQSGGAFGFRDQLQDSSAMLYLDPEITRRQILLHAAHQFVEGDVLHWWHPPLSKGIRTRFADDLLWLPFITAFYLRSTGDTSVLAEEARFVTARALEPGEDEAFVVAQDSGERASVYEHCCRAIDRSLTRGAHGLPLIGVGDWNDGMNRVGREGRGESVWLGFFLHDILERFLPFVDGRGDADRAARYRVYQEQLRAALNADDGGWDGEWYRRAYYDNGAPLGSRQSDECKIDVIAQAWAVLSGAAPFDRAERALDAMEAHLVSEEAGIIRLLTPAFDQTPNDPGYIKGYLPGVRENGGQYTHGALWAVRALAEAGRTERAAALLEMLNPVTRSSSNERVHVYKGEPYVVAADVYGVAPHIGRAGWTWYTGSAGWMYRVALESVLGFELDRGREIVLRPCIPAHWPGFTIRYRLPDHATTYELRVMRTSGEDTVVRSATGETPRVVDGAVRIPLVRDGAAHAIDIVLGADVGRRYRAANV